MSITNKIKQYKGWEVKEIETADSYNRKRSAAIDIFFNASGEPYKRGYVVSVTHEKGGVAKLLIRNKFDLREFINFI